MLTFFIIFGALAFVSFAVAPGCGGAVVVVYEFIRLIVWIVRGVIRLLLRTRKDPSTA